MYGTEIGLEAYATARGVTLEGSPSVLLTQSHDYIESLDYKGTQVSFNAKWPRTGVKVNGFDIDGSTVPDAIINAEYAQAIAIDLGYGAQAAIEPSAKREKLDVMEVEYQDGASSNAIDVTTMAILRPYLSTSGAYGLSQCAVRKA